MGHCVICGKVIDVDLTDDEFEALLAKIQPVKITWTPERQAMVDAAVKKNAELLERMKRLK